MAKSRSPARPKAKKASHHPQGSSDIERKELLRAQQEMRRIGEITQTIGDKDRTIAILLDRFRSDRNPRVRLAALYSLRKLSAVEAAAELERILRYEKDPKVAKETSAVLERLKVKKG